MTQADQSYAIFWGWKDRSQRGAFLRWARSATVGDGQSVSGGMQCRCQWRMLTEITLAVLSEKNDSFSCLEQAWHTPPQELSWCPSGSVLMKAAQWKEPEHRVCLGLGPTCLGNSIFSPKLCLKPASGTARSVFVVGEGEVLPPSHPTWNRGTSLAWLQLPSYLFARLRISLGLSLNKLI